VFFCAMRSSTASTMASMRGRSSSTRRAVKALLTRPRSRVWSGGLRNRIQLLVLRSGFLSSTMLWSSSAIFSAAVLALAGLYQLSPLKSACLAHCRGPAEFLAHHWRPGRIGALMIGVRHGAYCVGCCWMLMALLFVGGVMNLVWIAALAILVLVEKLSPAGAIASRASGFVLLAWAVATLVV